MKEMQKERLFTRNFTLLILGQVSSLTGNYTLKFALSMYVLEQTGSAAVFAGMLAAAMLPTILLSPFGGILADRANRKWIMVALDTLSGLVVLAAGLLLPLGRELWVTGTLLVLLSVLAAFESPTVQACVPQMVAPQNLVQGNAMVSQVSAVTSLVTPFLGSLFYTAFGIGPVFASAVVCFWLTALLECMIHLEHQKLPRTAGIGAIVREDLAVSAHFLRREQPDILKLLLYPTGAWIPGLTLNCLLAGLIYGFFLYRKPTNFWRILAAELTVALLVNVLLGTFWLSQVYGKAFMVMLPARLIKNVIKAPVDSIILYLVMTVLERAGVFRMLKIFRPGKSGVWRQEKISGFDKK